MPAKEPSPANIAISNHLSGLVDAAGGVNEVARRIAELERQQGVTEGFTSRQVVSSWLRQCVCPRPDMWDNLAAALELDDYHKIFPPSLKPSGPPPAPGAKGRPAGLKNRPRARSTEVDEA